MRGRGRQPQWAWTSTERRGRLRWLGRSGYGGVTSGAWGLKVIPGHLEDELREQMSSRAGGDSRTKV